MCSLALSVLMFGASLVLGVGSQDASAQPMSGSSTATARVAAPSDSKCPAADRGKSALFTADDCTQRACNSARQSAIAQLRRAVDKECEIYIRADSKCTTNECK